MIITLSWGNNEAVAHDSLAYRIKQDGETGWWFTYRVVKDSPPTRLQTPGGYKGSQQEAKNVAQADAERTISREQFEDPVHRTVRG